MKSFKNVKLFLLLTTYLFIVVTGSFHFHAYSFDLSGSLSFSSASESNQEVDFIGDGYKECSIEHFFQTINLDDNPTQFTTIELPESKPIFFSSFFNLPEKPFYHAYPLRAPPVL